MKAERRHELKHNELADWIGEFAEGLKPHATGVLVGLAVLAVIVLGSVWYFSGETAAASRAWSQYFYAFNEREPQKVLQNLATEQSGSKAAWWALEAVADMNLGEGAAMLYSDRTEAKKRLEAAKEAYLKVEASGDPMLKTRARLGLGKVYESLCEPEKAREYYEKVASSDKDSAIGKAAAADAKRMKDAREVEFLAWFEKQTPKRPAPMPGIGGMSPALPTNLSDRPDMSLPKLGLDNIGTGAEFTPPPSFPTPAGTTPGGAAPAATPPDASAPEAAKSTNSKPADVPATTPETGEKKQPE
jgi:tetratricopeptide (TPR) repeat protein